SVTLHPSWSRSVASRTCRARSTVCSIPLGVEESPPLVRFGSPGTFPVLGCTAVHNRPMSTPWTSGFAYSGKILRLILRGRRLTGTLRSRTVRSTEGSALLGPSRHDAVSGRSETVPAHLPFPAARPSFDRAMNPPTSASESSNASPCPRGPGPSRFTDGRRAPYARHARTGPERSRRLRPVGRHDPPSAGDHESPWRERQHGLPLCDGPRPSGPHCRRG